MNLPLWSHLEDVTYHTTQSILAILPAHFSSLNLLSILVVLPPSTHTSDPLTLLFYLECTFWVCRLAEHGERQNTDDPSHFPHLKLQIWLRHIKAHSDRSKVKEVEYNIQSSSCKNLGWTSARLQRVVKNEIPPVQQCKPLGGQLH